ncbi:MAG: hypothetical protein ABSG43_19040, partial [Solirubrobacteraceae bacterium]
MLASITPLGERGRQAHWGITLTVFALAASGAGLLAGLLAGSIGAAVTDGLGVHPRFALLGAAALAAVVLDAGVRGVPGPRRQVDERWLDEYRGWVYGLGY